VSSNISAKEGNKETRKSTRRLGHNRDRELATFAVGMSAVVGRYLHAPPPAEGPNAMSEDSRELFTLYGRTMSRIAKDVRTSFTRERVANLLDLTESEYRQQIGEQFKQAVSGCLLCSLRKFTCHLVVINYLSANRSITVPRVFTVLAGQQLQRNTDHEQKFVLQELLRQEERNALTYFQPSNREPLMSWLAQRQTRVDELMQQVPGQEEAWNKVIGYMGIMQIVLEAGSAHSPVEIFCGNCGPAGNADQQDYGFFNGNDLKPIWDYLGQTLGLTQCAFSRKTLGAWAPKVYENCNIPHRENDEQLTGALRTVAGDSAENENIWVYFFPVFSLLSDDVGGIGVIVQKRLDSFMKYHLIPSVAELLVNQVRFLENELRIERNSELHSQADRMGQQARQWCESEKTSEAIEWLWKDANDETFYSDKYHDFVRSALEKCFGPTVSERSTSSP